MDPKVYGKLLTLHRRGYGVDEESSVIYPPSGGAPKMAPRCDLMGIESCDDGNRVLWSSWMFLGYMSIYRRKKSVRGATRGPRGWGGGAYCRTAVFGEQVTGLQFGISGSRALAFPPPSDLPRAGTIWSVRAYHRVGVPLAIRRGRIRHFFVIVFLRKNKSPLIQDKLSDQNINIILYHVTHCVWLYSHSRSQMFCLFLVAILDCKEQQCWEYCLKQL